MVSKAALVQLLTRQKCTTPLPVDYYGVIAGTGTGCNSTADLQILSQRLDCSQTKVMLVLDRQHASQHGCTDVQWC